MPVKSFLLNFVLSLGLFCVSLYLAWQIGASSNFLYTLWYEVIDIDTTISAYGPKNKNRHGFEQTSKQEQVRLFSEIVASIQNKGEGLNKLRYKNSNGKPVDTLLTEAEIVHLKDVANLVGIFKYFAIVGLLIAAAALFFMFMAKQKCAKFIYHLAGSLVFIVIITGVVFLVGPTKIFYAGHELMFPDNHPWFFYYEDSLMSTMMKAPDLFGPIACELAAVTFLIWFLLLAIVRNVENYNFKCKNLYLLC